MSRFIPAACVVSLALAAACAKPAEPAFTQTEANQIRQRTQQFEAAFNGKDPAKLVAYYTPESVLMPPNAPTVRGTDPIRQFYAELYAQGGTDLEIETKDLRGHGPLAYEAGSFSLNRRPPQGNASRDRGKYVFIWRKQADGSWLIEQTIWSSDLPDRLPL